MPTPTHTVKINLPGGIVPAGDLLTILEVAEAAEVEHIRFGHRQQLLFTVAAGQRRGLRKPWPRPISCAKLMPTCTPTSAAPT